jgi:hypothetical protein
MLAGARGISLRPSLADPFSPLLPLDDPFGEPCQVGTSGNEQRRHERLAQPLSGPAGPRRSQRLQPDRLAGQDDLASRIAKDHGNTPSGGFALTWQDTGPGAAPFCAENLKESPSGVVVTSKSKLAGMKSPVAPSLRVKNAGLHVIDSELLWVTTNLKRPSEPQDAWPIRRWGAPLGSAVAGAASPTSSAGIPTVSSNKRSFLFMTSPFERSCDRQVFTCLPPPRRERSRPISVTPRLADPLRSLQPLLDPLGELADIGAGLDRQRGLGSR